jgi:hypothetical protein
VPRHVVAHCVYPAAATELRWIAERPPPANAGRSHFGAETAPGNWRTAAAPPPPMGDAGNWAQALMDICDIDISKVDVG